MNERNANTDLFLTRKFGADYAITEPNNNLRRNSNELNSGSRNNPQDSGFEVISRSGSRKISDNGFEIISRTNKVKENNSGHRIEVSNLTSIKSKTETKVKTEVRPIIKKNSEIEAGNDRANKIKKRIKTFKKIDKRAEELNNEIKNLEKLSKNKVANKLFGKIIEKKSNLKKTKVAGLNSVKQEIMNQADDVGIKKVIKDKLKQGGDLTKGHTSRTKKMLKKIKKDYSKPKKGMSR